MQGTHAQGTRTARAATYKSARQQCKKRSRAKEKNTGPKWVGNAFLKQTLEPIAPKVVIRSSYIEEYNYLTEENYNYLLASAIRFAELTGNKIKVNNMGSVGLRIANLYYSLKQLIGEDLELNIETEQEKLVFVVWDHYKWGEYDFLWIPVSFVEKLNSQLRQIAISFLHQLRETHGLQTTDMSDDVMMLTDHFWERSQDPAEENPKQLERLSEMYHDKGKVGKLMYRIRHRNYLKDLDLALAEYATQSEYEIQLIDLMKKGLEFIGKDKPSILSYSYNPFYNEDEDLMPVYPEQMIRLTYDVKNDFEAEMRYWINETRNNGYEISQCATHVLRPDSDESYSVDTFPRQFYAYLDELLYFLTGGTVWQRTH